MHKSGDFYPPQYCLNHSSLMYCRLEELQPIVSCNSACIWQESCMFSLCRLDLCLSPVENLGKPISQEIYFSLCPGITWIADSHDTSWCFSFTSDLFCSSALGTDLWPTAWGAAQSQLPAVIPSTLLCLQMCLHISVQRRGVSCICICTCPWECPCGALAVKIAFLQLPLVSFFLFPAWTQKGKFMGAAQESSSQCWIISCDELGISWITSLRISFSINLQHV